MKLYAAAFFAFIAINACTKPSVPVKLDDTPVPVEQPVPPATPVNTIITAYVEPNDQNKNPLFVHLNEAHSLPWSLGSFSANTAFSVDQYNTNISMNNDSWVSGFFFENSRNLPLTASSRNYVDGNIIQKVRIGSFTYPFQGGEWPLPIGGKITYTPNSFGSNSSPGVGDPEFGFVDPTVKFYAITNPSFTADKGQKRWYLKSYGIIKLATYFAIAPISDVELEYPIPTPLAATAPDSIQAWLYKDNKWMPKHYAKKTGGNYKIKIDVAGTWNFAVPVKGFYKTIRLRTDAGVPVTNAILNIKNRTGEVNSARTDADGNAICFLPTSENFTVDVTNSWNDQTYAPAVFNLSLSSFETPDDVTLTIPASSPHVMTIKGNANLCNGSPIPDGTVAMTYRNGLALCYIPVTNGKYSAALVRPLDNEIYQIKAINNASGEAGTDTAASLRTGLDNVINLSTCQTDTRLFINYSIDGKPYSIIGDATHPEDPPLAAYQDLIGSRGTTISCNSLASGKGYGIGFVTNVSTTGVYKNLILDALFIGTEYCNHDFYKPMNLTITRSDLLPGGYFEGSLDFYYKDGSNITHHFIGSFRLKRLT